MQFHALLRALQTDDGGVFLPEGGGSTVIWVLFIGVVVALYLLVSRTRRRAEEDYWKGRERAAEELPEPDDPRELP